MTKLNTIRGMANSRVGIMKVFNRNVKEEPVSETDKEIMQLQYER